MTAILVAAVFAVQMAVDGVALKAAISAWVGAQSPADQSAAFQVAESVRWTEKGLGGFFQLINGLTLLAFGTSIALGRRYPKWIGIVGALAGLGFVAGGTTTAHTGFSPMSGKFLTPATLLLAVFLVGVVILMWRRSRRTENSQLDHVTVLGDRAMVSSVQPYIVSHRCGSPGSDFGPDVKCRWQ